MTQWYKAGDQKSLLVQRFKGVYGWMNLGFMPHKYGQSLRMFDPIIAYFSPHYDKNGLWVWPNLGVPLLTHSPSSCNDFWAALK